MARTSTATTWGRLALESSLGASKTTPNWLYPWCRSMEITPNSPILQPRYLTGDRMLRKPVRGESNADGRIVFEVGPENFGHFLYGVLSAVSTSGLGPTTDTGHSTTQYTYKLASTQPTFEAQIDKGFVETWASGGIIQSMGLTTDRNSILTADLGMMFQQEATLTDGQIAIPTYSVLDCFTDMKGTMERDDGVVTDMDSFALRIDSAPLTFKTFGSQWFTDVVYGKADIGWEIGCSFADATEFRRFLGDKAGTNQQNLGQRYQTVKLEWQFLTGQTHTVVGHSAQGGYYELKLTAYGALYPAFPHGIPSDSALLTSRIPAVVRYDATATCDLQIDLVCEQATVWN